MASKRKSQELLAEDSSKRRKEETCLCTGEYSNEAFSTEGKQI